MEEDRGDPEAAAGVLGSALEEHVLPIMHWEALSLRIAELEKQEKEKRERAKSVGVVEEENFPEDRCQVLRGEKEEDVWRAGRVPAVASRFYSPKNLQLCFINNTESDEEDEEEDKSSKERHSKGEETSGGRTPGLKQEVRAALKALRDKLWAEQRENE
ncbi:uncharacterized protein LOC114792926 isoform X2 [Denticeps clupeoides]|nr:uncharacterized protein LOC114792926 isoform X2 [Denticeps clupeoides]